MSVLSNTTSRRNAGTTWKVHWLFFLQFISGANSLSWKEWRILIALAIMGPPYLLLKKLTKNWK